MRPMLLIALVGLSACGVSETAWPKALSSASCAYVERCSPLAFNTAWTSMSACIDSSTAELQSAMDAYPASCVYHSDVAADCLKAQHRAAASCDPRDASTMGVVCADVVTCDGDGSGGSGGGGGGGGGSYDGPEGTGKLALKFEMDEALWNRWGPEDRAVGRVVLTIWDADDVSAVGPRDGAVGLDENVIVPTVDLSDAGGPTAVRYTSAPLPVADLASGKVAVLGFMDSDSNYSDFLSPDTNDPMTLPKDNTFQVIEGTTTTVTVYFGVLVP